MPSAERGNQETLILKIMVITRRSSGSHRVVGVVATAAELVPALGAAEVHAAAFSQSVLEPAVRTGYKETTQTRESPGSYSNRQI